MGKQPKTTEELLGRFGSTMFKVLTLIVINLTAPGWAGVLSAYLIFWADYGCKCKCQHNDTAAAVPEDHRSPISTTLC